MKDKELIKELEARIARLENPAPAPVPTAPVESAPEIPGLKTPAWTNRRAYIDNEGVVHHIQQTPSTAMRPKPLWTVGQSAIGGQVYICVTFTRGPGLADQIFFVSHPDKLRSFKKDHTGTWKPFHAYGETCPPEIEAEYRRLHSPTTAFSTGAPGINAKQSVPDITKCPPGSYFGALPTPNKTTVDAPRRAPRENYEI